AGIGCLVEKGIKSRQQARPFGRLALTVDLLKAQDVGTKRDQLRTQRRNAGLQTIWPEPLLAEGFQIETGDAHRAGVSIRKSISDRDGQNGSGFIVAANGGGS